MRTGWFLRVLSVVMVAVMVLSFVPVNPVFAGSKDWKLFSREHEYYVLDDGILIIQNELDIGINANRLTMYDPEKLTKIWSHDFGNYDGGGVTHVNIYCISKGRIFGFDTEDNWAKCIDAKTGKLLWRTKYRTDETDGLDREQIGRKTNGTYFYLVSSRIIYVFNAQTGKVENKINKSVPMVENDINEISDGLLILSKDDKYQIVEAVTGAIKYTLEKPKPDFQMILENKMSFEVYVDDEGFGYSRNKKDQIIKFSIINGKTIWTSKKPFSGGFAYEDKNCIYLLDQEYSWKKLAFGIAAYSKVDGTQKWAVEKSYTNTNDKSSGTTNENKLCGKTPQPIENPVPYCSSSYLEFKFVGDKVVAGLGLEAMYSNNFNLGFLVFRLSDGKEIVRKSEVFFPDSVFQTATNRYLVGVKMRTKANPGSWLTVLDTWTGKDNVIAEGVYCDYATGIHYQVGYASYMSHIKDKSYFNVVDTATGKRVWFLEDKDKDEDMIITHKGKIIIVGGGLMDVFDIKTGKFIKRVK